MPKINVSVPGYRCTRCAHEWVPRGDKEPETCPKCKSPYWSQPRRPVKNKVITAMTHSAVRMAKGSREDVDD